MTLGVSAEALPLLEREEELRALRALLVAAREGSGGAVLVEGNPGEGKSRLLAEASQLAREVGMTVLRARADDDEREFPFGIALQLLEPALQRSDKATRDTLFAGAAGLARPLLEPRARSRPPPDSSALFSLVHGLFWLTHNLAENCPLVVLVDDTQWADAPSLRFLAYLARRVSDLPVAVVIAGRLGDDPSADVPLESLATRLRLAPLSTAAVTRLARLQLPEASDAFCAACAQATAGNPLFLQELMRTVAEEHLPPTDASVAQLRALAPEAVSRFALVRLSRLGADAVALARAVAVLGEASLVDVARLAGIDADEGPALAAQLVASGILADRELLAFSHPIVREAVRADVAQPEWEALQLRAAELLRAAGAPPERVAAHLLAAPSSRDPGVVDTLRLAAANAVAEGAPESAARYLRRALEEPPAAEVSAEVLVELGRAEAAAAEPDAAERFRAALNLREDPVWRARVHLMLGYALYAQGRLGEAAAAFAAGEADARDRDPQLLVELESAYSSAARLDPHHHAKAAERIERLVRQPPHEDAPGQRPLLADVAVARAWAGAPASEVVPLAKRAWAGGALLAERGPDAPSLYLLTGALYAIDELELDLEVLGAALREARRRASVMAVATASYCRSAPLYLMARIPEALADIEQAVRSEQDGWAMFLLPARAYWALALLERGDVAGADRALQLADLDRWRESLTYFPYLEARAQVRLAEGRPAEALDDALEAGRLLEDLYSRMQGRPPVQWRCTAALAAAATGERDRPAQLCAQELAAARASGRPREIGVALRTAAALEEGRRRIELLSEAAATLESSQSVLELLRTLVDLGAALRRAGRRQEARDPLRRVLDVASSLGATALASRAREELLAAGGRPRRTALRGVAALTPSELRVARLAGEGMRNREIAEALFVTPKTVDYHLRHVYQKLDTTRERLAESLAAAARD